MPFCWFFHEVAQLYPAVLLNYYHKQVANCNINALFYEDSLEKQIWWVLKRKQNVCVFTVTRPTLSEPPPQPLSPTHPDCKPFIFHIFKHILIKQSKTGDWPPKGQKVHSSQSQ